MFPWFLACHEVEPPDHTPETNSVSTVPTVPLAGPFAPLPGPFVPVGALVLTVDPLDLGTVSLLHVAGAAPGAEIIWWRGAFGEQSCPGELPGCLPLGEATILGASTARADGTAEWSFIADDAAGAYVVFTATADEVRTLPVMRRVWTAGPEDFDPPADPFPAGTPLLPGDWLDLTLEGSFADGFDSGHADRFVITTRGNEVVDLVERFARGTGDLYINAWTPPGAPDALIATDVHSDHASVVFLGQSLDPGAWTAEVVSEYGDDRGRYDVSVRIGAPTEPRTWHEDADGDGLGADDSTAEAPVAPDGWVWRAGDCDDTAAEVHPGAWDACGNGIDTDCTGTDKACDRVDARGALPIDAVAAWRLDLDSTVDTWDAAGDTDGDGVPEVWIGTEGEIARVSGLPGAAAPLEWEAVQVHPGRLARGDLDRDGRLDLAVGDEIDGGTVFFASLPLDATGLPWDAWGSLIGDPTVAAPLALVQRADHLTAGLGPDLVLAQGSTVYVVGAVARRDLTVQSAAVAELADPVSVVLASDLDADGIDDLVYAPGAGVLRGPLDGLVDTADAEVHFNGIEVDFVAAGDTDGDGHREVVLAGTIAGQAALFEAPTGELTLGDAETVVTAESGPLGEALLDLDGDGFDDWVFVGAQAEVLYGPVPATVDLQTDADLTLSPSGLEHLREARLADADGDGDDDLLLLLEADYSWPSVVILYAGG